jgi:hypothetical protein
MEMETILLHCYTMVEDVVIPHPLRSPSLLENNVQFWKGEDGIYVICFT